MDTAVTNTGRCCLSVCIPNKENDCRSILNLNNRREELLQKKIMFNSSYKIFEETARRLKSIRASRILIGQRISFSINRDLLSIDGNNKFNARLLTLTSTSMFGDYDKTIFFK